MRENVRGSRNEACRARVAPLLAVLVLASAGCEGPNRFTEPAGAIGGEAPRVVSVRVPEQVSANDIVRVEVQATTEDDTGVALVDIGLREGVVRDTTILFNPARTRADAEVFFTMPAALADTVVGVRVVAENARGVRSDVFEVFIPVVDVAEPAPAGGVPGGG